MTALSDYAENLLLDWVNGRPATQPTTHFVALSTTPTNDAGGITEPVGNGYARQAVSFGPASSGVAQNLAEVSFTATGGDWGTITHTAVFDSITGGNMLWHGALDAPRSITDGLTARFSVGQLSEVLD